MTDNKIFGYHGWFQKGRIHPEEWKYNKIHSKKAILEIIKAGAGTSGQVRLAYTCKVKAISQRHVLNMLKQLEREEKIKLVVTNHGRGCTTIIKLVR